MNKIILILSFLSIISPAHAYMSSIIVSDSKSKNVLGTASHLCFSLNQETLFFVTAAHVVEGVDQIEGGLTIGQPFVKLKKIKVDSEIDLAILVPDEPANTVQIMGLMLPCHSAPIFSNPIRGEAFDVLASLDSRVYRLDIEGFDSDLKKLRTETVMAPVIKSVQAGLPGRGDVGQVYMTTFKAQPGFSGGLVLGYEQDGSLLENKQNQDYSWNPSSGIRQIALGIVISADQAHGRVAIIPFMTIAKWFTGWDRRQHGGETSLTTADGIYNKGLQLISSVGLSSFGGVGTGRPAVGKEQISDIVLQDQKDKRWLSIGESWVEGDPLDSRTHELIKNNRQNLQGIFQDNQGRIKKTEAAKLPKVINIQEINKALGQPQNECSQVQMINIGNRKIVRVNLCEKIGKDRSSYRIESDEFDVKIQMQVAPDNAVEIKTEIDSAPAQSLSLRRHQNQKYKVKIEGLSGIEVEDKKSGETWIGPVK